MSDRYQLLRYRGDAAAAARPGDVLGCDDLGRPYEVVDAEVEVRYCNGRSHGTCECHGHTRTTVHLQYATPDSIRAHLARLGAPVPAGGAR